MEIKETDEPEMPEEILNFIDWQDDVTVYFCYEKYNFLKLSGQVFKKHWKNFLFYDDGPILLDSPSFRSTLVCNKRHR